MLSVQKHEKEGGAALEAMDTHALADAKLEERQIRGNHLLNGLHMRCTTSHRSALIGRIASPFDFPNAAACAGSAVENRLPVFCAKQANKALLCFVSTV